MDWLGRGREAGMNRSTMMPRNSKDAGDIPWAMLHAAVHEARSPLTLVAYASELLLDPDHPLPDGRIRQRVESIHQACAEASACITLLSRCIEIEQAGQAPAPAPFPLEALRDPGAHEPGPALDAGAVAHVDARLAGHFASTLWELAALLPPPRPLLATAMVAAGQLRLHLRAPGGVGRILKGEAPPPVRRRRGMTAPMDAFPVAFRARLLRRCLALLGGDATATDATGKADDVVVRIPAHPRPPSKRKPTQEVLPPCK